MANTARQGLRFVDRLTLLVAWVATCGLVYLFGFYTGKGTQVRYLQQEERVVRLPVASAPPAAGQRPSQKSYPDFYERLLGERTGDEPPAGRAATPAGDGEPPRRADAPSRPADVPTIAERSLLDPVPAAAPKPADPTTAATASKVAQPTTPAPRPPGSLGTEPTRTASVEAPHPPEAARPTGAPVVPPVADPARKPPTDPNAASVDVAAARKPPVDPVPARPSRGGWTIQVNPTRDRGQAEDLQYRLRSRGYDAQLMRVQRDGDTWYRIRIGRYATPEQANEVMRRLREQDGVAHVYVASE